eukprot:gnl/MRDRNA2_/MRDRNA2_103737_c0_seq1.p1 gnl/MRDRNA2_/MRDRNA2_103737_c0~~gnl/MRDRNA2_/MRDRNA2_103737_c0_seq1.p1  ORF type:complete len:538 (+),score=128.22 gnl/MRDRNA2_/MRDRNA2_103737_c0_seq1:59-1672(+)
MSQTSQTEEAATKTEDVIKFSNIENISDNGAAGMFKCNADKLGWKDSSVAGATNTVSLDGKHISEASSWPVGRSSFALEMRLEDARIMRFGGFKPDDITSLKHHFEKCYKVDLIDKKVSSVGHSWGEWVLDDEDFKFMVSDKVGFEIRASDLSQVVANGKSELSLMMNDDDDGSVEMVNEIRFQMFPKVGDAEVAAQSVKDLLLQKAGLSATGDAVTSFQDVQIIAPRGRYTIEMYKKTMKLHGKTHSYTIKYSNITRLFCVPKPDNVRVELVIGLDQPLRQGQQTHLWLCVLMDKEKTVTADINAEPQDLERWKLAANETGPEYEVVTKIVKHLTSKPVTIPASDYQSENGFNCMQCNYKGQPGCLYPLKKSFLFVDKPVIWQSYDQVDHVYFMASVMRGKSFDFKIQSKSGLTYEFTNIQRDDYKPLFDYLQKVGIPIQNIGEVQKALSTSSEARAQRGPALTSSSRPVAAAPASSSKRDSVEDEDEDDDEEDQDEDFEEEDAGVSDDSDENFEPEDAIDPADIVPSSKRRRVRA